MLPTIAIDARFAASPLGLGRYVRELVSRMVLLHGASFQLLVMGTDHAWLGDGISHCQLIQTDIPHYSFGEQFRLPRLIDRLHPDVYFVPHFNAPVFSSVPTVITVHDLILHHYPNGASFLKQMVYRTLIGTAVRHAKSVITVSSFVADELRKQYGERIAGKTIVVPEGVSDRYTPRLEKTFVSVLAKYDLQRPFFLYVGSAKEHKNVPLLIEAFVRAGVCDTTLLLVTGGKEADALHPLPRGVHMLSNVSEEDMPVLYSAARAFFTASLYEGFGLPIAEALACGCPVVASDRAAIVEVAAGHAHLLQPDVQSFAHAFSHPPARCEPYRTGEWDDAATRTLHVLLQATEAVNRRW